MPSTMGLPKYWLLQEEVWNRGDQIACDVPWQSSPASSARPITPPRGLAAAPQVMLESCGTIPLPATHHDSMPHVKGWQLCYSPILWPGL